MNMSFYSGDVNGDYFYMNSSNWYVIINHTSVDYTKKRDEISTNKYLRGNNGLLDVIDTDDMLLASVPNQYFNMEYNNEHHKLESNGNISTSNNSSVSTFTLPYVTSTNE